MQWVALLRSVFKTNSHDNDLHHDHGNDTDGDYHDDNGNDTDDDHHHDDTYDEEEMDRLDAADAGNAIFQTMYYWLSPIERGKLGLVNLASHFIRVQIFQIDFALILSASKYFR